MSIYCPLCEALGIEFVPASGSKTSYSNHYFDEKVPSPFKGQKHTDETKERMSSAHRGKTFSLETLEKMRQTKLGKKLSVETKMKMSEARKGAKNGFYGKKHSQETIDKIKDKCEKLVPPNKGITGLYSHSNESKKKISESLKNRKHSDETREKIRKSKQEYWNEKKGLYHEP